jgi:hypothetical protein
VATEDSGWDDGGNVARARFRVGKQPRGMIWVVGAWTFKIPPSNGLKFLECAGLDVGPLKVGVCFALHLVCIATKPTRERAKRVGTRGSVLA